MGIERTTSRVLVHTPKFYGGFDIPNFYVEMNIQRIETLLSHNRAKTPLGTSQEINLDFVQLYSGLATPVFELTEKVDYLESAWYQQLHNFLVDSDATIRIKNKWTPVAEQHKDIPIMEKIILLDISPYMRKVANKWRMFFKVIHLSDIVIPGTIQVH